MRRFAARIVMVVAALSLGPVALRAADKAPLAAPPSEACTAEPNPQRIQVLVELVDTPTLRVYEAALAASTAADAAQKEAAARGSERTQDQRIKDAQASVARELSGLGARELYRVRRSFNGISVVVTTDKLAALRALAGVKAIYPRLPQAPPLRADGASGSVPVPPPADTGTLAAGMRAYVDPATGQLTSTPTDAQVKELDRQLAALVDNSTEDLEFVTYPDGTKILDLKERFQNFSTATLSPTGAVKVNCNGHGGAAARPLVVDPAAGLEKE